MVFNIISVKPHMFFGFPGEWESDGNNVGFNKASVALQKREIMGT